MTAESQNFKVRAGEVKDLRFTVDNPENVDLNGATARWWSAPLNAPSSAPVIQKTGIALSTVNGVTTATVQLNRADTLNLNGDYYHELLIEREAPTLAQTAAVGTMTVKRTIIRP